MIRTSARGALLAAILGGLGGPTAVAEEQPGLHAQCWTGPALRASRRELRPVYRRVALDLAGLRKLELAPASPTPANLRGSIRRVDLPPDKKLIALTFDLCETPHDVAGYDGGIVDYLRAHKVKATFFAGGKWIETHGERAAQLMTDPLFELGNHGWTHQDVRRVAGRRLQDEILLAQRAYERARARLAQRACLKPVPGALSRIPERLSLFRFPYGTCDAKALHAVAKAGLLAIQWDVVTGDPSRDRSARAIAATVLRHARPGSIVIAHANGRGWNTAAALPLIVPALREQGYEFVTVGELLAAGKPVIARTCYQWSPGDHRRFETARRPHMKRPRARDDATVFETTD